MHPVAVLLGQVFVLHRIAQQGRHQRQRQQDRAEQGKSQSERHRREYLPFHALEGEDRHKGQNDDELGKQDGPAQLYPGLFDQVDAPAVGMVLRQGIRLGQGQLHHQRLDQHHRTIDDDTEVHRTERNEVGGNAACVHQDESEQQGQRDDGCHRQRRIPVAQEQNEDGDHQYRTDNQVLGDGMYRMFDQVGTVVVRHDLHAGRQLVRHLVEPFLERLHHLGGVLPLGHLHDALHDIVVVVERHHAGARASADDHIADVAHQHGLAVFGGDHDTRDVLQTLEQADAAQHQCLIAALQDAAADIAAVRIDRLRHLVDAHAVFAQQEGIDVNLVFLHRAAEAHHIRHTRHLAQCRTQHPVLQGAHIVGRHVGGHVQHIAIHLAHRIGQRRQARLRTGRQRHVLQLLHHLLPRKIVVGLVGKGERDDGQAGDGNRAQLRHARHAAHLALDGQGDAALDFFRRLTRRLRDDLHLHVLHIGESFDRHVLHRTPAEDDDHQRSRQHEHALLQGKGK